MPFALPLSETGLAARGFAASVLASGVVAAVWSVAGCGAILLSMLVGCSTSDTPPPEVIDSLSFRPEVGTVANETRRVFVELSSTDPVQASRYSSFSAHREYRVESVSESSARLEVTVAGHSAAKWPRQQLGGPSTASPFPLVLGGSFFLEIEPTGRVRSAAGNHRLVELAIAKTLQQEPRANVTGIRNQLLATLATESLTARPWHNFPLPSSPGEWNDSLESDDPNWPGIYDLTYRVIRYDDTEVECEVRGTAQLGSVVEGEPCRGTLEVQGTQTRSRSGGWILKESLKIEGPIVVGSAAEPTLSFKAHRTLNTVLQSR